MAYYAAVISLKQTLHRLLKSSQISISPSSQRSIKFVHKRIRSLQGVLQELENISNYNSEMVESLHEQIGDAARKLEDAIETYVYDNFLSRYESHGDEGSLLVFSLDFDQVLKQEINYFIDMVKKMKDECFRQELELSNALPEEEEDDSLRFVGGMESQMVGLSDQFSYIKDMLLAQDFYHGPYVSISGMAGIGKTTLAKKIYEDPAILNYFDCRFWVRIGPKFQLRKTLISILAQLNYDIDVIQTEGENKLVSYLYTSLESKRYLIVLDDVWNDRDWIMLINYLPEDLHCRFLLITRLQHIAHDISPVRRHKMRFLNEEESWCLLREKVFGKNPCPFLFEKAGKKIAQNCDGLPLLIVTVADLLSKAEKTLEYWNKVADKKDMSIFIEANDKISAILLRSYKYLPQNVKPCFLYMGVFPSKCKIRASKLFNLWTVDDLSESVLYAKEHLSMLVSSNLVMEDQEMSLGGTKTCSLHSSFWHACVKQSWKEKFLNVISSFADISKEGVKNRGRLCIYNNVLFGIKEVYNAVESISGARSLICSGSYHQYPVPICFGLNLLKVLDVLSVRFYKFPLEVLKLIRPRYLALTYYGKVPASISKLWNLEFLIVCRHLSIIFPGDWSYLPAEIWNLQQLRHLQVAGGCLPFVCDALLPHLLKLSQISAHCCTKEIFERIPNLQKLGIQIELAPDADAAEPLSCFDHLSHLDRLESFKCVIVNPNPARPQVVIPPTTTFPANLRKLSLSGFGYPWEYIRLIAKLPNLNVLKLRRYAFRGPEWVVHKDEFRQLNHLLLEDMDLVHLRADRYCFQELRHIIIRHCYRLKQIPLNVSHKSTSIELVDSPLVADYIQKKLRAKLSIERQFFGVHVHSSWVDGDLKA